MVEVTYEAIVLLHLGLVQPHHLQAAGGTHPVEKAADGYVNGKFDQGEDDKDQDKDQADSSPHDPGFHQTHITLKCKV